MLALVVLSALLLGTSATTASTSDAWLDYEPVVVELQGVLKTERAYGPPGFGEDPKRDAKEDIYVLQLDPPINVRASDELNTEEKDVREIQLVVRENTVRAELRRQKGKRAGVKGTLFHAHTGHHHRPVLLDLQRVQAVPAGAR